MMTSEQLYHRVLLCWGGHWNEPAAFEAEMDELESEPGFDDAMARFVVFIESAWCILKDKPTEH